ncbi:MAG: polysaccharide biosynthesis protein, partial [Flavobacterium sp.]
ITRYFMTIPEAVELVLEAGSTGKGGEIFVFDMGDPIKIVDLANSMIKLAGLVPKIDIDIVYTGLRPGEKLYEELLSNEELTIPTHNQKIKIARVRLHDLKDVEDTIASLLDAKYSGDEIRMIQIIKNFIPEYKSNNSLFETLDDSVTI